MCYLTDLKTNLKDSFFPYKFSRKISILAVLLLELLAVVIC